ncbi:hypothetical protein D3C81_2140800 [compost metagenome]
MPLQLFIERATRQLQLFKYRFHIALVPGQRRTQTLRLKRLLLRRQRLPRINPRCRFIQAQHLTFGNVR